MLKRTLIHQSGVARVIVEVWRREYNEERPKRSLGGPTPETYAQRLTQNQLN